MTEIPLETLKELYRQFCLARYDYSGPYADEDAREAAIEADARSYWYSHRSDGEPTPLSALVEAVWAAGRESAYTEDEWEVCFVENADHAPEFQFFGVLGKHWDEVQARAMLTAYRRGEPTAFLQHRRIGATVWSRVDV